MTARRKTSLAVGVLYAAGTLFGVLSLVSTGPLRAALASPDFAFLDESRIISGALFVLAMGLALALIPIVALNLPMAVQEMVLAA